MFWFKNAIIYRLTKTLDWSTEKLRQALQQCAYRPCDKSDVSKFGWTNPLRGSELLYHAAENKILLVAQKEEKILPAHVVNNALNKRIHELEKKEERKLNKVEKQVLKDDVIAVLLQQAFSKYSHTALFIDVEKGLIYVDASSYKRSEDVLALLRKTLGSLPVVPLAFAKEPILAMTAWVVQDETPEWLDLQGDSKLIDFNSNGEAVLKNQDFHCEDIAQRFDADFILMTSVLSELTELLLNEFGGEKEHDQ